MTQITADTPACEVWRTACDEWDLTTGQHASNQAATAILEQWAGEKGAKWALLLQTARNQRDAANSRAVAQATRIAELEAREKALLEKLEPFAKAADYADAKAERFREAGMGGMGESVSPGWGITRKHCNEARAALQSGESQ